MFWLSFFLTTFALSAAALNRTNLLQYVNEQGSVTAVHSPADWEKRRAAVLVAMQEVMGPLPGKEKRCALDVKVEEETDRGSYVLRKITYSSEPDGQVPAYLLIPKAALAGKKSPAVLALHQTNHRLGNKVVVGLGDNPDDAYGVALAERGFVVLAPAYPLLADYQPNLKGLGYQSGTMKAIWDNIRGLDLLSEFPFVNTNGFGAIGHSLGGHNSVYTAVFDQRIKIVVTSCGLDSYRDYMNGNIKGWTSARYMPKLLDYKLTDIPFDFHEMIGALAPRACFISAPIGDTNFKWKSVDAIAAAALPVYELYGAHDKLVVKHPDCAHRFPPEMREEAYRLIEQTLAVAKNTNVCTIRVLAVNYDPVLKEHGGVRLRQHMKWNEPRTMTTNLMRYLRESSGGYADYRLVDFVDVDAWPQKRDGFRYDEKTFLEMWKDKKKAHKPDSVSYAAIFKELDLQKRLANENISEIWVWGAPYFGTDEYAMKIPDDQVFYQTKNPWFYRPYDIPDCGKTIWVMGFNYEVGEDNALHSYGHRVEGILSLTIGRGVWEGAAGDTNVWSRFTRQADKYPHDAHVGNVHGGPNAKSGYDYGQTNLVLSGADDWFNYPNLTGAKKLVNCDTWGKPHHLNFMKWWLNHLPKTTGQTDGVYNNWWRYVIDYDAAVKVLPPPGGYPNKAKVAMY